MNFWNTYLILIGIGIIILTTTIYLIKYKIVFCSEKYFNKLESMYGNIDKKRIVKNERYNMDELKKIHKEEIIYIEKYRKYYDYSFKFYNNMKEMNSIENIRKG
ncbi:MULTISPECIES: hypothetical protein [unclassified Clostridioides]|uniref:hypothetical protein n=1 Tax=unclassified Clostridioides TaxID=2635829 RepID=UPI001D12C7F7|nr:hypothetical protein [Clostridioides sp. ES-S-0049-03]MCC0677025.1 hypothetical protein [Clostridioides sp. ES-W-0018-02]MCC0711592.1 hypothetical protein [Clostridioides sp. ES-W-0017-02]